MHYFCLRLSQNVYLPQKANCDDIIKLMQNYARSVKFNILPSENENEIIIGEAERCELDGNEYGINVTENGIYIKGENYGGAIRGFMTLLENIFCYGKGDYRVECMCLKESPKVKMRMVHICVGPEKTFDYVKKIIKCCGVAKYTHILLESWGNLKFDTLKELAWPQALTKSDWKELINCAKVFGMEVVPFFQHLGHASFCPLSKTGKHVVLEQNLELEYLYYPKSYGWIWNFKLDDTKKMLRSVREELIELFEGCEYFHLGCDEAGLELDSKELCTFLNEVADELKAKGIKPIIWGDMLLCKDWFEREEKYECNSTHQYANEMLEGLSKDIIVADWQYNTASTPWKTSAVIKSKGFEVICCPWDNLRNMDSAVDTAVSDEHLGIMETTWNHLLDSNGIVLMIRAGMMAYGGDSRAKTYNKDNVTERGHIILMKVSDKPNTYETSGWGICRL